MNTTRKVRHTCAFMLSTGFALGCAADALAEETTPRAPTVIALEEIVVAGSRLKLSDTEPTAPIVVLDRARIEELGVAKLR